MSAWPLMTSNIWPCRMSCEGGLGFEAAERGHPFQGQSGVHKWLIEGPHKGKIGRTDCSLRQGAGGTEFARLGSTTCFWG